MTKKILCLDFDGVVHSYTSGWQGVDVIPDDPVPGAFSFIYSALVDFRVAIYSSRSGQKGGIHAMKAWVERHEGAPSTGWYDRYPADWYKKIEWPRAKPPAFVTLDDRALTFTGTWPRPRDLLAFKPWHQK